MAMPQPSEAARLCCSLNTSLHCIAHSLNLVFLFFESIPLVIFSADTRSWKAVSSFYRDPSEGSTPLQIDVEPKSISQHEIPLKMVGLWIPCFEYVDFPGQAAPIGRNTSP